MRKKVGVMERIFKKVKIRRIMKLQKRNKTAYVKTKKNQKVTDSGSFCLKPKEDNDFFVFFSIDIF